MSFLLVYFILVFFATEYFGFAVALGEPLKFQELAFESFDTGDGIYIARAKKANNHQLKLFFRAASATGYYEKDNNKTIIKNYPF